MFPAKSDVSEFRFLKKLGVRWTGISPIFFTSLKFYKDIVRLKHCEKVADFISQWLLNQRPYDNPKNYVNVRSLYYVSIKRLLKDLQVWARLRSGTARTRTWIVSVFLVRSDGVERDYFPWVINWETIWKTFETKAIIYATSLQSPKITWLSSIDFKQHSRPTADLTMLISTWRNT